MILTENTVVPADYEYKSDKHKHTIKALLECEGYAIKHRAGEYVDSDYFYPNYGICDNIGRGNWRSSEINMFSRVKDNLIRRLPSYSGAYHFPVRHPDFMTDTDQATIKAEEAWNGNTNKWEGEYGANRLTQLKELIQHCLNDWSDELTSDMTPAQRVGIVKGETICQRREDNTLWVLHTDDDSSDPYFVPHGSEDVDRRSIDLRKLRVMHAHNIGNMSVKAILSKVGKIQSKKDKLEAQIAALQAQVNQLQVEIVSHDVALIKQHKVKRV
jgi:hypothetical protein